MKKTVLLLVLALGINFNIKAQEIPKLNLTKTGIEGIIVPVDSTPSNELYSNGLNWVQETYKNPSEVLKANIENTKIRVNGYSSDSWYIKTLGMKQYFDLSYSIEITFKDDKYKLEYTITELSDNGKRFGYSYSSFFKKDGSVRKMYTGAVEDINNQMNSLSNSFYEYVSGKTEEKNSDW